MTDLPPNPLPDCYQNDPGLLPVAAAMQRILAHLHPVTGGEDIALTHASGRILAEDLRSPIAVPGHTNSAMDGYALHGAELPTEDTEACFDIVGKTFAGRPFDQSVVGSGQCVRIMTGAAMPAGTDTVVMQEHAIVAGTTVRIGSGHQFGQHVRNAGEDLRCGQTVLAAGTWLGPAELGVIASMGYAQAYLKPRIRVAYFSTGDEIHAPGTSLPAGGVYDSNRFTVSAMLSRLGIDVIDLGVIGDQQPAIIDALREAAARADVIITSGGVSTGEADYIREALGVVGRVGFWRIAIRPGRPLAFGFVGNTVFFGLPGNPVAVMVTFYQFVQPALRRLSGQNELWPNPRLSIRCTDQLRKKPGRVEYYRAVLERDEHGQQTVHSTGRSGSGLLHTMHDANCFIVLPEDGTTVSPGDKVDVQPFYGLI